jgi:hypothetical protein
VSPDTPTPPEEGEKYPIGLRAWAFRFFDPGTGELKNYRLPSFLTDSAAGFT